MLSNFVKSSVFLENCPAFDFFFCQIFGISCSPLGLEWVAVAVRARGLQRDLSGLLQACGVFELVRLAVEVGMVTSERHMLP
jgi:hypothetical protein